MLKDLEANYLRVGMGGDQVCQLLGPDERGHCGDYRPIQLGHMWWVENGPLPMIPFRLPPLNTQKTYLTIGFGDDGTIYEWGYTYDD